MVLENSCLKNGISTRLWLTSKWMEKFSLPNSESYSKILEKEGLVRKGEFFAILTVGGQFCYGLLNLICKKSSSGQTSLKFRLIALLNVIRLADFQLLKYER